MKSILSPDGAKQLRRFACARTAVVLDFDGTIAPIVAHKSRARIPSTTHALLRDMAALFPSAVLSGRGLSDIQKRVPGIPFREVVGNHGLEWSGSASDRKLHERVEAWRRTIDRAIRDEVIPKKGIEIEDKSLSLSVHFRRARDPESAGERIEGLLLGLPGLRLVPGKFVFNALPDVQVNKGTAVLKLVKKLRCERAIYLGDDWTDEDVFALRPKSFLLDIRVGRSSRSKARFYLPSQTKIDGFLQALIALRAENGPLSR